MEANEAKEDDRFIDDRCFMCGFCFREVSVLENGERMETKRFQSKLCLTEERLELIQQVLHSPLSALDLQQAVCTKCYTTMAYVTKHEKTANEAREKLTKMRRKKHMNDDTVGEEKRMLSSPASKRLPPPKKPAQAAVNIPLQMNAFKSIAPATPGPVTATVETAFIFKPIGYVQSPFAFKNGTPRQAMVCTEARGIIRIEKTVFTNPEHSLEGLEKFSHIWIVFIFHKNGGSYTKAKVRPPRLNGDKVGLYSTRCPYRPNNIGLSLAKLESVEGPSITVSGIDMLDGTPVIDLKPYIEQYDNPGGFPPSSRGTYSNEIPVELETNTAENCKTADLSVEAEIDFIKIEPVNAVTDSYFSVSDAAHQPTISCITNRGDATCLAHKPSQENSNNLPQNESDMCSIEAGVKDSSILSVANGSTLEKADDETDKGCIKNGTGAVKAEPVGESKQISTSSVPSLAADWITSPPVSTLRVRFTPRALDQLTKFTAASDDVRYRLKFMKTSEEARQAIVNILHEDPRSVYRRTKCVDSLYYFTVDVIHVTCWFDNDDVDDDNEGAVEVVKVKPAVDVDQCKHKFST